MKKVYIFCLSIILLVSGCSSYNSTNSPNIDAKISTETPSQKYNIEMIANSSFFRESDVKDENGFYVPPYKSGSVIFSFEEKIDQGEFVTLVPICSNSESFNKQISSVKEYSQSFNDSDVLTWFNATVDGIDNNNVLTAQPNEGRRDDTPFDIVALYPAVNDAKLLSKDNLNIEVLNEKKDNLLAVIDINSDNQADVLIYEEKSDYTITRYYVRVNDRFVLLRDAKHL